jgi:hypothetical protein
MELAKSLKHSVTANGCYLNHKIRPTFSYLLKQAYLPSPSKLFTLRTTAIFKFIGIYLSWVSDSFPIQNCLKQGYDALSPLLISFASEYAIRKVQKNQVGLKSNGTNQLLDCESTGR